jgi:hypothetical protein
LYLSEVNYITDQILPGSLSNLLVKPLHQEVCNIVTAGLCTGKLLLLSSDGFSVVDPSDWQFNTFQPGTSNLQSFAYTSDGTIYAFGNDYNIFKSTDQGLTFDQHIRVGDGDP